MPTSYFQSTDAGNEKKTKIAPNVEEDEIVDALPPWVEKYRPVKVDEIVYQEEVVMMLQKCLAGADLPNLLFHGPPGTGKTSTALALCRQLFPTRECFKDRVLELNASDERGIEVVRTRIKKFTTKTALKIKGKCALKIVILDEADAMTNSAQSALRRTMESESHSTRFFLICNYITRIIDPLTSRCAKFRFKPLSVDAQKGRLEFICDEEDVGITSKAIDQLINVSGGDLRKSITLLQSLACSALKEINDEDVRELSGYVPDKEIDQLMASVQSGNIRQLVKDSKHINAQGYSAYQIINQLSDVLIANDLLHPQHKSEIFEKIAVCEKRLLDGADEFLQLLDLLTVIQKCFFQVDE